MNHPVSSCMNQLGNMLVTVIASSHSVRFMKSIHHDENWFRFRNYHQAFNLSEGGAWLSQEMQQTSGELQPGGTPVGFSMIKIHNNMSLVSFPAEVDWVCKANVKRLIGKEEIGNNETDLQWSRFSGGSKGRGKQSCGEKAAAPVGLRSVWLAELCTHSGLSLSSSPPPCLLKAGILFLFAGIPCLYAYFHSCLLCISVYACVPVLSSFKLGLTLFNYGGV